ncbi:MAG: shikimate dehydrogenase, partial [Elusimicrobia bacterium]|nr:shikimate dehydrogenase [Elusimicrobiota bacterium]
DLEGFRETLARIKAAPKTALVLGAGGTALVVIKELLRQKAAVHLWNRTADRAKALGDRVNGFEVLDGSEIGRVSSTFDVVVNATSVGLKEGDGLPHPDLRFRRGQIVVDVIYHRETQLMKLARAAGATVSGGLPMLLFQGAASFRIWTGAEPNVSAMKQALDDALTKKGMTPIWPSDI